ncbi:MAG: 4-alpha-glucanotransferase [Ardenticatenales bacterium]|nr:4-alpha-glucanotransferase [Ardenticatenales bacterium]
MRFPRRAGILLHPTSLPGPYGIGDLGPAAYRFVDWLQEAGQRLWQVLPLGPTGYGDSPYQSFSAFAGNPLLISPERLLEQALLTEQELSTPPSFPTAHVEYGEVIDWKESLFRQAFARFQTQPHPSYEPWVAANEEWLEDYALFIALKAHFGGGPWKEWPEEVRTHDKTRLDPHREALADEMAYQRFLQFLFFQQWITLRAYAHQKEVSIVGDIPIFIAHDSADAWANRELFSLNDDGSLEVQAGVPPDYFSETGQLWGNPLYRWDMMEESGYEWWIERFRAIFNLVDMVRLDHFRGFEAYWTIPGNAPTAVNGEWRTGPGAALFREVRDALGPLPIIAEDLGVITPEVDAMRDEFAYPGMRILQFAFSADISSNFLPHNYVQNTVAYTGTHDNDTTRGWFESLDEESQQRVLDYFDTSEAQVVWAMARAIVASVADTAIVPMQDIAELGNEARMNLPGRPGGNWQWRATEEMFSAENAAWLAKLSDLYGRCNP